MDADSYPRTTLSTADLAEQDRLFGTLAQRTRELVDATMRTEVDHAEVEEVTALIEALTTRLGKQQRPGWLGVEIGPDGTMRNPGNAVVGLRNPVAPPLRVERTPDGTAAASFHLGAMYEGPPGLVHGGVSALILDPEGNPTVEAEGLFILPRWAREPVADARRPDSFE